MTQTTTMPAAPEFELREDLQDLINQTYRKLGRACQKDDGPKIAELEAEINRLEVILKEFDCPICIHKSLSRTGLVAHLRINHDTEGTSNV